jgi:hypothetical protein
VGNTNIVRPFSLEAEYIHSKEKKRRKEKNKNRRGAAIIDGSISSVVSSIDLRSRTLFFAFICVSRPLDQPEKKELRQDWISWEH